MADQRKLEHRPLTAEELEVRAAEFDRDGTHHADSHSQAVQITVEVTSSSTPEPEDCGAPRRRPVAY